MRVLHVVAGNLYGGVEAFLATLARKRELEPGMQPEFALCYRGRLFDEIRAAKLEPHLIGPARLSRPWTLIRARQRLRTIAGEQRIDVVICHGAWSHVAF